MNALTPVQTERRVLHSNGAVVPSKTFIRVSRSLELTRSPVDGQWRGWVPVPRPMVAYEPHEMDDVASAWMVVAVAPKAAVVIASAKSQGFH